MPFHFVSQATIHQHRAAISRVAFQEDRASFHHTYNRRAMCHDRRVGLLWFHRSFGLAINHSIGTAPYPLSEDIWRRSDSTFQREEDFDELSFDDYLAISSRGARRTLDHLGGTPAQWGVLSRGLYLTDVDMADASPAEAIEYTSVVGIMMGEAVASQNDEVRSRVPWIWLWLT